MQNKNVFLMTLSGAMMVLGAVGQPLAQNFPTNGLFAAIITTLG